MNNFLYTQELFKTIKFLNAVLAQSFLEIRKLNLSEGISDNLDNLWKLILSENVNIRMKR